MRQLFTVAGFELSESFRSGRTIVLILMFVLGSLLNAEACVSAADRTAEQLEQEIGEELGTQSGNNEMGASVASSMIRDEANQRQARVTIYEELFRGDEVIADSLADYPMILVFHARIVLPIFLPFLLVLLMADVIAGARAGGGVRFALVRTSRAQWAFGKLLGQTLLLGAAMFSASFAVTIFMTFRVADFDFMQAATFMGRMTLVLWAFGFAYLGAVLGVSQITKSPWLARGLAFLAVMVIGLLDDLFRNFIGPDTVLTKIVPGGYHLDLWQPGLGAVLTACGALIALGLVYFSMGHAFFRAGDA